MGHNLRLRALECHHFVVAFDTGFGGRSMRVRGKRLGLMAIMAAAIGVSLAAQAGAGRGQGAGAGQQGGGGGRGGGGGFEVPAFPGVPNAPEISAKDLSDGLKNPSRWLTYSGDYGAHRNSPLKQLTPA